MLPPLTSLQFFVVREIATEEVSGRILRERLAKVGINHNRAAFYQLMARLEDADFVTGRNQPKQIGNQTIIERIYSATKSGRAAIQQSIDFYSKESS